jgi:hypothetical protein
MPDDFLSQVHHFDRLEIRGVRVPEGAKADQVAAQMGIHDPVAIPAFFGDGDARAFGDRFTANITGVFQADAREDEDGFRDASVVLGEIDKARASQPNGPGVVPDNKASAVDRPEGAWGKSFAPVRVQTEADGRADVGGDVPTPPVPSALRATMGGGIATAAYNLIQAINPIGTAQANELTPRQKEEKQIESALGEAGPATLEAQSTGVAPLDPLVGTIIPGSGAAAKPNPGVIINFQTSHYINRIGAADVQAAENMASSIINAPNFAVGTSACFTCNGVNYQFRTFVLPDGTVNVGTLFPIK